MANDLDLPTGERAQKKYATLQAEFALSGFSLYRSNPSDGPVTYMTEKWGQVTHLNSLDSVDLFFKSIGSGK